MDPPSLQYGPNNFVNFETPHVHSLEKTSDGKNLLAVNTAEGSLMVFSLSSGKPELTGVIMTGAEPVSVRARTATEVWVVNRLSNSISVVDVNAMTLLADFDVCHAPGDVVFAGSPAKAVVSCTRPNQLAIVDPVSRTVTSKVNISGESPRALALSNDGKTVFAAIFESGTPTTILAGDTNDSRINNVTQNPSGPWGGVSPVPNNGKLFNPPMNAGNPPPPPVSTIVYKTGDGYFNNSVSCSSSIFGSPIGTSGRSCYSQDPITGAWAFCAHEGSTCTFSGRRRVFFGAGGYNSTGRWQDDVNGDWTAMVTGDLSSLSNRIANWDLVDRDVAAYNVSTGQVTYQTRLMNAVMAISVNPANGQVYVVGTDATNYIRYQPVLNGRFLRVNLAHFVPGGSPSIVDLNPHLNYKLSTTTPTLRAMSIGDPRSMAWTSDGQRGYIAGLGSNNVVVVDPLGKRLATVNVGQGPSAIVIDDSRGQVYVMNKFDASISVLRISDSSLLTSTTFFDPTPAFINTGRKFLYNSHLGSGNGHIACASCHIDAKTDRLAWDLGDPGADFTIRNGYGFHPMKGPMVTQTLQNMIGSPSLHHRGDRGDIFAFAASYHDLQGADAPLDTTSMTQLQSFLATIAFPPNPNRNPDNSFSTAVALPGPKNTVRNYADAGNGMQQFTQGVNCSSCHIGSRGRSDVQSENALHLSQPMAPETMQGFFERLGMFWQSVDGSTVGTGIRPNGAHDSTLANESTTDGDLAYMLSFEGPQDGIVEQSANSHAGVGLQVSLTPSGATQANGSICAHQNATCTFSGTREVIFGAPGNWTSGVFTNSAACNVATFGDPAPGAAKTCAIRGAALSKCSAENGVCVFSQLSEVFFGTGNSLANSMVLRNNAACVSSLFGDPAVNSVKACYIRLASEFARVNYMLGIAETGKAGLVVTGAAGGMNRGAFYVGGGYFQTDMINQIASLTDLYSAVTSSSTLQLMLVPRGSEYRIGVDANLDGRLNGDQLLAKQNPRAVSPGNWQTCAAENGNCSFTGMKAVRFGAPGQYSYGVFWNGTPCDQATFADPALGQTKACAYAN